MILVYQKSKRVKSSLSSSCDLMLSRLYFPQLIFPSPKGTQIFLPHTKPLLINKPGAGVDLTFIASFILISRMSLSPSRQISVKQANTAERASRNAVEPRICKISFVYFLLCHFLSYNKILNFCAQLFMETQAVKLSK